MKDTSKRWRKITLSLNKSWRSTTSDKWDVIVSGNWIQKAVWNRMVTVSERNQPHKTPVTSTWTPDFLTREGEVRKAMDDWLRDKTVSWKAHRRLLQTNVVTFPSEDRLQKWGKHPDGIFGLCKRSREMVLELLGGRPARVTTGHLVVCVDFKTQRTQVPTMPVFNRYKNT